MRSGFLARFRMFTKIYLSGPTLMNLLVISEHLKTTVFSKSGQSILLLLQHLMFQLITNPLKSIGLFCSCLPVYCLFFTILQEIGVGDQDILVSNLDVNMMEILVAFQFPVFAKCSY